MITYNVRVKFEDPNVQLLEISCETDENVSKLAEEALENVKDRYLHIATYSIKKSKILWVNIEVKK